jgi:hypothetical protein
VAFLSSKYVVTPLDFGHRRIADALSSWLAKTTADGMLALHIGS